MFGPKTRIWSHFGHCAYGVIMSHIVASVAHLHNRGRVTAYTDPTLATSPYFRIGDDPTRTLKPARKG
jgi:hypothetical protein